MSSKLPMNATQRCRAKSMLIAPHLWITLGYFQPCRDKRGASRKLVLPVSGS